MEAGDSGARQSRHSPNNSITTATSASGTNTNTGTNTNGTEQRLSHPTPYHAQREPLDRPPYRDHPAMATASVLTPSAHYHAQPSYPSPYPQPGPAASIPTMISSEPRKAADDSEGSTRQSLPSISEVISGSKSGQFPPHPPHHTMPSGSGLPSPFAPMSRSYPEADNRSSPQPLHPAASYPPRPDALPSFADSPRSAPFNGRPSIPPVSDRRPSPSRTDSSHHHPHESQRPSEPHGMGGAYPHPQQHPLSHPHQPQPHQPPMSFHGGSQLPPGQVPLPAYPISPRHAPHHPSGPHDPRGPPPFYADEPDYAPRPRHEAVNRHFETWSYQENLSRIGSVTRTIFNFAEGWGKAAQEQHGSPPVTDRLPTEAEVGDMLSNVELVKHSLEQVREMVQISIQERAREGAQAPGPYDDDHDVAMYGGGMKPSYAMTEVKKRRGRAAPPGRCHSCNRIDTPEWRRGPDGARTLCNACGLHYAKLERKRQLEARSIRPKPEDRN